VSATITNRLFAAGDGTRVVVETDLGITGRQAQFGRGVMQDVATQMLRAFADRLEREILSASDAPGPTHVTAVPAPAPSPGTAAVGRDDDGGVLDVGDALRGPLVRRAGLAAAGVCCLLLAVARLRARRGLEVTVRYR
jgi:hypothetical protein